MTTRMPWVKLYTEMLDDPKISALTDYQAWTFVQLLLFAGECDMDGAISDSTAPFQLGKIAWRLREREEKLRGAVTRLLTLGLVEERDGGLLIPAFAARQGRPQAEKRQIWRDQQAKHRDMARGVSADASMTPRSRGEERRVRGRGEETRGPRPPAGAHPQPHPAVVIFREETQRYPKKATQPEIENLVGRREDDLALWRQIVHEWVAVGWNPVNVRGMLDCFTRQEIPNPRVKASEPKSFSAIRQAKAEMEARGGD